MLQDYIPVLLHVLVAVGFATVTMLANIMLGRAGTRSANKDSAYECGVIPEPGPQPRFSVKFYLIAMLFILFDIEVVFMYPWAVIFKDYIVHVNTGLFFSMLTFVVVLLFGFAYALKKGALNFKS